jgi:glycosyltransferase involved in cell wall biosynthesis
VKLNWFSPLPPAKTEIAAYAARLLPVLARRAEVTLWTDQADWDPALEKFGQVRPYAPAHSDWRDLNRGDLNIYHLGNNLQFHGGIWETACRHPGVIVLHDLCMHNFFAGLWLRDEDPDGYFAAMARQYGSAGLAAADKFWRGLLPVEYMGEKFPLTLLAVEPGHGVLVHTRQAFNVLAPENRWPVAYAPLPLAAAPLDRPRLRQARRREGGQPFRLILFGHIWKNRRLEPFLRALAPFPARERFHLDVYGELWDREYVTRLVRDLGVAPLVSLHGFVTEGVLEAALTSAHLAVNLRYPTMGEASASQLRIWQHALPSLVSPVGWYGGLPETAVSFVRPEHETADIQEHLRGFLDNPGKYARQGEEGRRLLEECHCPERYVQTLLDLAGNVRRFRARDLACYLAARAGGEMAVWTSGVGSEKPYRKVAEEIHHLLFCVPPPASKESA